MIHSITRTITVRSVLPAHYHTHPHMLPLTPETSSPHCQTCNITPQPPPPLPPPLQFDTSNTLLTSAPAPPLPPTTHHHPHPHTPTTGKKTSTRTHRPLSVFHALTRLACSCERVPASLSLHRRHAIRNIAWQHNTTTSTTPAHGHITRYTLLSTLCILIQHTYATCCWLYCTEWSQLPSDADLHACMWALNPDNRCDRPPSLNPGLR